MTKLTIIAAFFCLAVPAALAVPPAGKGKPESNETSTQAVANNPAKACKAERGTTAQSIAAFNAKYGSNANMRNALGKCVSMKAKLQQQQQQQQAAEQQAAEENAAKKCKAERGTTAQSIAAFNTKYGTNPNKRNAFGKCVSKLAKANGSSS